MDLILQDRMGVMADIVLVLTQGALTLCQGGSHVVPLLTSAHVQTVCSAWRFFFLLPVLCPASWATRSYLKFYIAPS